MIVWYYLLLQWEFRPCGKGFIINSVHSSDLFLMLRDLKGLHLEGSAQVVTGTFPTCWEVEVMGDRSAPGPVDEPGDGDIFARYVSWLAGFVPRREDADLTWTSLVVHVFSIRLPHFDGMALCFKGSHAGAPVSFF